MTPERQRELLQLISALCDETLAAEGQARLEELLAGDAACRRFYLAYADMHAHLLSQPGLFGADLGPMPQLAPPPPPAPVPARRLRPAFRYGLAVTVGLAASVLVQILWLHPPAEERAAPRPPAAGERPPVYVASLTQTPDCVWDQTGKPGPVGPRLPAGELRLQKGVARIRFDSGPDLVVQGPADLRVDSGTATVRRGKVVFRAEESAASFDLQTPCATLVNHAAECAVVVDADGEEVHVFDGEVQRTPRAGATDPEVLTAGEARRYGPTPDSPGQPMPLDPDAFTRTLAQPALPLDPSAGLLAYEGFDYPDPDALRAGKANGGIGWTSRWMSGLARPAVPGEAHGLALNPKEGLHRAGAATVGGSFDFVGFARYHRRLATPVRLDADGAYYLSFLFRREGPPADPLNALAILLRSTDELQKGKEDARLRLNVGVGGPNQLFTHLNKVGSRTPVPLRYGETYLLIAKIVASAAESAQVFMRIYGPDDPVESEDPGAWTMTGPPFPSRPVFDWLEIHINSKTRQTVDEIRLGTTWPAVAAPWIAAPAGAG